MCLILLAYDYHPDYLLVVAANRDEYYSRPSAVARFWDEETSVLAGKDLEHRGTWLGITRGGRFAALTNFRDPASYRSSARSRGALVRNYLITSGSPFEYLADIQGAKDEYNGFNIVLMEGDELWFYSSEDSRPERMGPGIYGISNQLPDTPWPKVVKGKETLGRVLKMDKPDMGQGLMELLSDGNPARDQELPNTGVSLEWERLLSSIFIRSESYGTRASTVLLIDRCGGVSFCERSFGPGGSKIGKDAIYKFVIEKKNS